MKDRRHECEIAHSWRDGIEDLPVYPKDFWHVKSCASPDAWADDGLQIVDGQYVKYCHVAL